MSIRSLPQDRSVAAAQSAKRQIEGNNSKLVKPFVAAFDKLCLDSVTDKQIHNKELCTFFERTSTRAGQASLTTTTSSGSSDKVRLSAMSGLEKMTRIQP